MNIEHWSPLIRSLDNWHAQGRVARFWLRDDDAVTPTPALSRLLDLCRRYEVPVALAVIPAHADEALAPFLDGYPDVDVLLHGWSHTNYAPPGQKKQELGAHRPPDIVLGELAEGFRRLHHLFKGRFSPMLVPPWNRIDKALLPHLREIGLLAVSAFGHEKPADIATINTHADIMDWHDTRGCRPVDDIVADIVKRLNEMQLGGTMGLLTHHLVHDEPAWTFLDQVFAVTSRHPACRWYRLSDLLASAA